MNTDPWYTTRGSRACLPSHHRRQDRTDLDAHTHVPHTLATSERKDEAGT